MKNLGRPSRPSRQNHLVELLTTHFDDANQACDLFEEFLRRETYDKAFCLTLIARARKTADPWNMRRLAVLMLENQVFRLDPAKLDDFDFLLTQLNLKERIGLNQAIVSSVLKEGYSTTDLRYFIPQFRSKLQRLNRVHDRIRGKMTSPAALHEFVELSRRDCKLSLARYLFTPKEVVDEILKQVRVTDGLEDLDVSQSRSVSRDVERAINLLPDFEGEILRRLCEASNVYWVSGTTSSEINSLVEYPMSTVALVIKPPGSDIEFELKRAGRKGAHVLNVVYARNGYTVPPSHRLDGASMQELLRYEASNASRLALVFRLVHGAQAPIPDYISRSTIFSVPVSNTEAKTLDYFTEPQLFGERYSDMRSAMKQSIEAFMAEGGPTPPRTPGVLGLTAQFVGQTAPAQAILCGTSSFRLDKLAAYLSPEGSGRYFKDGLRVEFTKRDARRLADELIEEVLGVYSPPSVRFQTYGQYLKAAFGVPENRARSDQVYLSLVEQIARFWGTLVACGAYSRGESFVARNVGLKSFWDDGEWKVKIIFMDHDAVVMSWPDDGQFYAKGALPNITLDERYIWGRSNERRFATSELGYLQSIYRIGSDVDAVGQELAKVVLKEAYKKTQHELLTNPKLKRLFSKIFIDRLLVWDSLVAGYFQRNGDESANMKLKKEIKKMLTAKGYKSGAYESYMETIEKHREFLERYSFLSFTSTPEEAVSVQASERRVIG